MSLFFRFTDLSRNRFCELPEDITSLAFLERLLVFHNTIRSIPDTIRGLHSLTYLDLRLVSHERFARCLRNYNQPDSVQLN